ncbi:Pc17g00800 [Penicillium rubens Wisconsin 54-1255]|uniref:Pc17g00800 protein n=1 Tax=Penicillium rubens (strain ATCC 28089 / DSM 1075 / NRRL 1951 / Wisconsin 54-1255) TaxID=500485 RepID=B6HB00_PENRW|nr:Pc17g00800 [Penicillium rubens Wisconsin 54-1255]
MSNTKVEYMDAMRSIPPGSTWTGSRKEGFTAEVGNQNLSASPRSALLRTQSVDTFYFHAADRLVPFDETLKKLDSLRQTGKFRRLGLSNFSAYEIAEIVVLCHTRGWIRPSIHQGVYNAISRNLETEIIPACRRYGLDVVVYNPLAGNLLTGRYTYSGSEDNAGRYSTKVFLGPIYRPLYFEDNFEAL